MSFQISWRRVMTGILCVLAIALTLFSIAALDNEKKMDAITEISGNFMAVLFGALTAFWLQSRKDDLKEKSKEIAGINLMMMGFTQRLGVLLSIQKETIDPIRRHQDRHLFLRPSHAPWPSYSVDYDILSGLLAGELAPFALKIAVSDKTYLYARSAIESQNEFHKKFQQALIDTSITNLEEMSLSDIRMLIGEKLWHDLEETAGAIIREIDKSVSQTREVLSKFPPAYKKLNKRAKIISCIENGSELGVGWI